LKEQVRMLELLSLQRSTANIVTLQEDYAAAFSLIKRLNIFAEAVLGPSGTG